MLASFTPFISCDPGKSIVFPRFVRSIWRRQFVFLASQQQAQTLRARTSRTFHQQSSTTDTANAGKRSIQRFPSFGALDQSCSVFRRCQCTRCPTSVIFPTSFRMPTFLRGPLRHSPSSPTTLVAPFSRSHSRTLSQKEYKRCVG